ncbi:hypothetical protein CO174_01090 [Candidatus Uhrbacteria bacterium CG_4_9_14_3_um_filter_50_9]|uniref:POTRA domain-containing protein n=1 Tax=Candidatus Uhrbacteria bacterium CG_4_9_14_3_um_filter_50_9 TaxID=1975035 RepID=A0A2M7XDT6_9BACT|nr:MAG: hypothetical protein CO174_01090 [Candidatus Uhrbacteria bacterium CG_4_9_14_3_um_filter_50_9]
MPKKNYFKRDSRKRYQSKRFQNPFFKRKSELPWKHAVIAVGVISVIVLIVVVSLGHQKLNIRDVVITGVEHSSKTSLEFEILNYVNRDALFLFTRANIFLFRPLDLVNQLSSIFTFATIDVSTQGTVLYITLEERTSNLIWKTGESEYIVDLTGTVVRKREGEEIQKDLPLFIDKNNLPVSIGEAVLTEKEVNGTLLFHEHLQAQGISFYDTIFDRLAGKWVSVTTAAGYALLFDPTGDIDAQASRLETVLATQVDDPSALDYIDLRFGDHIYFK